MAQITLEFNVPEEESQARTAIEGHKWKYVLWDLDQKLRSIVKYYPGPGGEGETWDPESVQKIRDILHELMAGENLTFDE